jgi:hypothetical protein
MKIRRFSGVIAAVGLIGGACSSPGSDIPTATGGAPGNGTGGTVSTGGVPAATGGLPSATGGIASSTGGVVASTGGTPSATGGTSTTTTGGTGTVNTGGTSAGGSTSTGGSSTSTGGAAAGGEPSSNGGTAGKGSSGGTTGTTGGSSTSTGGTPTPGSFPRPAGKIANNPQPATSTNLPKDQWQKGFVSPTLLAGKHLTQPAVVNGYLLISGNEEFWFYDVSNPAAPKQISTFKTPGGKGAEAESHTVSFARYGNTLYLVTLSGTGIDTWDVTNTAAPKHVGAIKIPGTNYGDYTEAVWGVDWQGQYIYVGATNNGIKVVDAADPAALKLVAEVPTSQFGGVSAGPLDAVGNVLVVMTPKENGGAATLDISDPLKPTKLASFTTDKAYIGQFYRRWVFFIGVKAWDVLGNPKNIGTGSAPLGRLNTEGAEYMSFSDDYMFLGHVRAEIGGNPGASKISVADPKSMKVVNRIWGHMDKGGKNDDQFTIPIGNLLVIADDQAPYAGWFIAVHQADPDSKPPIVDTVIPNDKATAVSTKGRIGISFSDNIELATVNNTSFIVRPVGGAPLPGKYGVRMGVLNFDPDTDLQPGTTYEVVLPKGGIADLVGNTLDTEWKSTFTTN